MKSTPHFFHLTPAKLTAIALGLAATAPAFSQPAKKMEADAHPQHESMDMEVTQLLATIMPVGDSNVRGSVLFEKVSDGVRVTARIGGLEKNQEHAFHVHEFGDLTSDDGTSAGGHFNPEGHDHGLPDQENRHAGDLGNLKADDNGNATHTVTVKNLKLNGKNSILGRAVIVHAKPDDGGQPTGNAGDRIGAGTIGLTEKSISGK